MAKRFTNRVPVASGHYVVVQMDSVMHEISWTDPFAVKEAAITKARQDEQAGLNDFFYVIDDQNRVVWSNDGCAYQEA